MPIYQKQDLLKKAEQSLFSEAPKLDKSRYGYVETFEVTRGRKVSVEYGGEYNFETGESKELFVNYFIPRGAFGIGIGYLQVDKAYRITKGGKERLKARKVQNPSELESVASGLLIEIEENFDLDKNEHVHEIKRILGF
jgi:hypothetical protein